MMQRLRFDGQTIVSMPVSHDEPERPSLPAGTARAQGRSAAQARTPDNLKTDSPPAPGLAARRFVVGT